jgi:predicted 2-oxoglutarate/Fe(II)-dependent dioxygenase YbiX
MKRVNREKEKFYTDYDIESRPEGSKSPIVLQYANYYIKENFLSNEEVDDLNSILSQYDDKTTKGTIIGYSSEDAAKIQMRDSNIFFIKDKNEDFNHYEKIIVDRVADINKNIFNLDLTCFMDPQYTSYGKDQYFNWHPDGPFGVVDGRGLNCIPKELQWRKLSMSLMLNDTSEYKGGQFSILNYSGNPLCNGVHTLELAKGTAILFPAFASHTVAPVTEGVRKTLIYWFCGPRWK